MKLVKVKDLPSRKNHDLQGYITEFMESDALVAKVYFAPGEYKSENSAQSSLCQAILRAKAPIRTSIRNGELYLIRTDM